MKRRLTTLLTICVVLLGSGVAFSDGPSGSGTSATAASPQDEALIDQLGSDHFADRTSAARELHSMGKGAIPLLVEAVRRDDIETRRRALMLLSEMVAEDPGASGDEVLAALEKMTLQSDPAASFAEQALDHIRADREEQSLDEFRRLGADVNVRNGVTIRLGTGWRHGERPLGQLKWIRNLRFVSIEDTLLGDSAVEHLAGLVELERLYLGRSGVTAKSLPKLDRLARLQHLSLQNLPINDHDLAALPQLPDLQGLGLDGTRITDTGLKDVSRLPKIRLLWLDRTPITTNGLTALLPLQDLTTLYLSETQISGEGLLSLRKLPQLRFVSFKGCQLIPEDMERLSGMEQLETLGLDHTNVADEHLSRLSGLPNLRVLWLSNCKLVTDESVDNLLEFKNLGTLYLHGSGVSEHGGEEIRKTLPNCRVYR